MNEKEDAQIEMPKYVCNKEVWALKIASVAKDVDIANKENRETDGSGLITPSDDKYAPFHVKHDFMSKHNPQAGGYYVLYKDGYASFSPAEAFEDGYTESDAVTFGHAMEAAKQGKSFKLPAWADDVFISIQQPDANSKMTAPYFYVTSRFGMVPWIPTMIEMLSDNWQIVE